VYYSPNNSDDAADELDYARQHFFLPHRYRDPFHIDNAWLTESFIDYDKYDLLMQETRDAIGNRITVGERDQDPLQPLVRQGNDYRVLQPELMMDPNRNCTEVRFDALGLVVGTPATDLLKDTTTRIIYDLHCFHRTRQANPQDLGKWQPTFAATLARETHVSDPLPTDGLKIQISFSYSDGFGREIQKKIQAEQGAVPKRDEDGKIIVGADGQPEMTANSVSPRWVGSGWTVFNNKGKPVRQYEPFFTDTHCFEFDVRIGVSPVLFYDPVERVIATLHPNHTWEKVVFDPWRQETWDVSDTILAEDQDPGNDNDVSCFFRRLPEGDYLPTWYDLRTDSVKALEEWPDSDEHGQPLPDNEKRRASEKKAAQQSAVHADTPATAYFDTLGRPFLTLEHNRFERNGAVIDEKYPTRVELDIEGNQHEVIDANDRVVMRYDYDMLGNVIHQASMEAGARWKLNDITGNTLHAWDDRCHHFWSEYDQLHRPVHQYVRGSDSEQSDPRTLTTDILVQKIEYGESQTNDAELNLRTQVFKSYDGAGVVTNIEINPETGRQEAYDFKGNLLRSSRQLTVDYKNIPNWSEQVALETDSDGQAKRYTSSISYDALNRPVESIAPDNSITRPVYNEANLLERLNVNLRGSGTATPFVKNIDYDAKGQRTLIEYGNSVITNYEYDPLTFRLIRLHTTRPSHLNGLAAQLFKNNGTVQNLYYTYDPAGNITRIADEALPVINHGNQEIEPTGRYTYDALYRLIEARGREHIGQSAFQLNSPNGNGNCRDYPFAGFGAQTNDPKAVQNYTERFDYDATGNFLRFVHQANGGSWQRDYAFEELSPLAESGEEIFSNRLSRTTLHPNGAQPVVEPYTYDAHGNMTSMPHLPLMQWDFNDQLAASSRQVRNDGGTPEITYYVYDAGGHRVRKVTERQATEDATPAIMKERIYLGGFEIYREYDGSSVTRTNERETLHIMDDQQRIALVETKTLDVENAGELNIPVIRYQLGNHLGSASLELDRNGAVISYEEYHPYGATSYQAGRSAAEISLKRYRYTGMERDEETGLNYHGARYYAGWLGRWCSCDPLGIKDGMNVYVYVSNNPINHVDLKGTEGTEGAGVGVIGAIPRFTGVTFTPTDNESGNNDNLLSAGETMVTQMQKDLLEYYAIPTTVTKDGDTIKLDLLNENEKEKWAKAEANVAKKITENIRDRNKPATLPNGSNGSLHIATSREQMNENDIARETREGISRWQAARQGLLDFIRSGKTVELRTGMTGANNSPLVFMQTGRGVRDKSLTTTNIRINPFSWYNPRSEETSRYSSERARARMSATIILIREICAYENKALLTDQTVESSEKMEQVITTEIDLAVFDVGMETRMKTLGVAGKATVLGLNARQLPNALPMKGEEYFIVPQEEILLRGFPRYRIK